MKKIYVVLLGVLLSFVMLSCGCNKYDYSEYYNLPTFKGLEIYCWKTDGGEWKCGAMPGTNRLKSGNEIAFLQEKLPCPLSEMNKILMTYSEEERKYIIVYAVDYPYEKSDALNFKYKKEEDIPKTYIYLYNELGLKVPEFLMGSV